MVNIINVVADPSPVEVIQIQLPGAPGPQGDKGNPGQANVLTIGTVGTGAPGSNAIATISGVSPNQVLNLTIPRGNVGATGPANTLTVGTINTVDAVTGASATITGAAPNQVLNLVVPRGYGVIPGGVTGDVLVKKTGTDYDTKWVTPASTPTASAIVLRDANGRAQVSDPNVAADIATKGYADGLDTSRKTYVDNLDSSRKTYVDNADTALSNRISPLETANTAATDAATVSAIVKRDSAGRAKVTDPSVASDIATKNYTDNQIATRAATVHTHTASQISDATTVGKNVLTAADAASARTAIGAGTGSSNLVIGTTAGTAKDGAYQPTSANISDAASAATPSTVIIRDSAGRAKVVDPSASTDIATKNYVDTSKIATRTVVTTKASSYTIALTDEGTHLTFQTASSATLTVPDNTTVAFPSGGFVDVSNEMSGILTITAAAGVILQVDGVKMASGSSWTGLQQYAGPVRLWKRTTSIWEIQRLDYSPPPVLRLRRNLTGQPLTTGQFTPISWDSEDTDTANMWSSGTDIISTRAGYYLILCSGSLVGAPTGRIAVRVDYAAAATPTTWIFAQIGSLVPTGAITNPGVTAQGTVFLAVGDRIRMNVFQDSGSTINTYNTDFVQTSIHALWLRA